MKVFSTLRLCALKSQSWTILLSAKFARIILVVRLKLFYIFYYLSSSQSLLKQQIPYVWLQQVIKKQTGRMKKYSIKQFQWWIFYVTNLASRLTTISSFSIFLIHCILTRVAIKLWVWIFVQVHNAITLLMKTFITSVTIYHFVLLTNISRKAYLTVCLEDASKLGFSLH